MFWTAPNIKDLLAWTRCLHGCFGQDQMSTNGEKPQANSREVQDCQALLSGSSSVTQNVVYLHWFTKVTFLYPSGCPTKTRLCKQLNQCKLSVYPFLNELGKAVQGSLDLKQYVINQDTSSVSWPRVSTGL